MSKASQIVEAFGKYRMLPTPIDEFESVGKSIFEQKVNQYIANNQKIEFVMLGFPFKSKNDRDKVLGKIPDLGEEVSINTLDLLTRDIKSIYSIGAKINIVSDGLIFNEFLEVPEQIVTQYREIMLHLTKNTSVDVLDLNNYYKGNSLQFKREQLVKQFGVTEEHLQQQILFNPDTRYLYSGMIRFMEEELAIKEFPSRNQLNKAAKLLTRQMMLVNEAYSNLVKHEHKDNIRLSMHPSVNNGAKFSIQMIPGDNHHSAWHSATIQNQVNEQITYTTMHKKDAIEKGYELIYENNQPHHFVM